LPRQVRAPGDHEPDARHRADLARRARGGAGTAPEPTRQAGRPGADTAGLAESPRRTSAPPAAAPGAGTPAGRPLARRGAPRLPGPGEQPLLPDPRAARRTLRDAGARPTAA